MAGFANHIFQRRLVLLHDGTIADQLHEPTTSAARIAASLRFVRMSAMKSAYRECQESLVQSHVDHHVAPKLFVEHDGNLVLA